MAHKWAFIGDRVFIVRWTKLDVNDFPTIVRNLANARTTVGKPIDYTFVIPSDHPLPNAQEREGLEQLGSQLNEHCRAYHMVLEGTGIIRNLQRTAMTATFKIISQQRPTTIHATVEEALRTIAPDIGVAAEKLVEQAKARGILTAS